MTPKKRQTPTDVMLKSLGIPEIVANGSRTLTPEQVERARSLLNMGTEQSWSLRCRAAFKLLREVVENE